MFLLSHFRAGSGAVLVETREESRLVRQLLSELPSSATVCTVAAPGGALKNARTGKPEGAVSGLAAAYDWAAAGPGRVLVVYDLHAILNNPGQWRGLSEALPRLRQPKGARADSPASLVVAVAPHWELVPQNPLKGVLPILTLPHPDRSQLAEVAGRIHPLGDAQESVVDALCGLTTDAAEQVSAEVISRTGGRWDAPALRSGRAQSLKEAGLELWAPITQEDFGGYGGFRQFCVDELVPWVRDAQLSVRRILKAGVPGVGKSYGARYVAGLLGCECVRLSIPSLKAGIVGMSEAQLRRAFRALDALGADSPLVVVIDEIDSIARDGLDGGTSSGMFAETLTWLQESRSQCVVIATLNRLDKLDAAMESRFQARFWYDLPGHGERAAVARVHFTALGCSDVDASAWAVADYSEGFSGREIAEHVCRTVARLTRRKPSAEVVYRVCGAYSPASRTQAEQLQTMRRSAASLRRANDSDDSPSVPGGRLVSSN